MANVTFDKLVIELRELRLSRDRADARLLLRLAQIEREHIKIVLDAGCESFAQFAEEFVKPARYEAFKTGLDKVGVDEALAIGSDATIVAGKTTTEVKAVAYTGAVRAWVAEHNGTLPTRQTAKHILMQVDPREEQPKAVRDIERRDDELTRLRSENAELRAKLRAAESELARLRKLTAAPRRERAQAQPHARGRKEKPKG